MARTRVEVVTDVTEELVDALASLVPQLSSTSPPPGVAQLTEVVRSGSTSLLVARGEDRSILGTLTLVVFRIPTGMRAWIEDVVVDVSARGDGVGEALALEAVRLAGEQGALTVDLTSRPSREAANRLYKKIGFRPRETNVYRFQAR